MLTNKKIFSNITNFFRTFNPNLNDCNQIEKYLWEKMVPEGLFKKSTTIHQEGQWVKKAYYVVSGYVVLYKYDEAGQVNAFRIYPPNSIVIRNSFLEAKKSPCNILVAKDTVLKSFSYEDYLNGCNTVPDLEKLMLRIANSYEQEEVSRNELISQPARLAIQNFYESYQDLLPPGKILTDKYIASYLHVKLSTLKEHRKALFLES